LEAMACGAVPLVSDIEGNREWVSEASARLFAPGDPKAVGVALERALDDREWTEGARELNRRTVEARGDWDVQMERIESLFAGLGAARAAGGGAAGAPSAARGEPPPRRGGGGGGASPSPSSPPPPRAAAPLA